MDADGGDALDRPSSPPHDPLPPQQVGGAEVALHSSSNHSSPSSSMSFFSSGGSRLLSSLRDSPRKLKLLRPSAELLLGVVGDRSGTGESNLGTSPHRSAGGGARRRRSGGSAANDEGGTGPVVGGLSSRGTLWMLPPILMHHIFDLVLRFSQSLEPILMLSLVSFHWYDLTQHRAMWELVVRRFFVAYPLIQRLARAAPLNADDEAVARRIAPILLMRGRRQASSTTQSSTAFPATSPSAVNLPSVSLERASATATGGEHNNSVGDLEPPSNSSVRRALREVTKFNASRRYHDLVQRRRAFVLHAFFSLALLCITVSLTTAICATEGLDPITVCNAETTFNFVWMTYVSVFGAVIANIVMETHFEPQPLIRRLRLHTDLIRVSSVCILLGFFFIGVPTVLVQGNVLGTWRVPWIVCFSPCLLAFAVWQMEVIVSNREFVVEFLRTPYFNHYTMYHGFSHSTPTLFCGAVWCISQYLTLCDEAAVVEHHSTARTTMISDPGVATTQCQDMTNVSSSPPSLFSPRAYLILGTLPGGLCLFTLTIVFILDYSLKHQTSDLVASVCLAVANLCPVLIAFGETFRGYTMLPILLAALGFFIGHFYGLRKRLDAAMFDPDGEAALFDD